jgi:hypothetical protein
MHDAISIIYIVVIIPLHHEAEGFANITEKKKKQPWSKIEAEWETSALAPQGNPKPRSFGIVTSWFKVCLIQGLASV